MCFIENTQPLLGRDCLRQVLLTHWDPISIRIWVDNDWYGSYKRTTTQYLLVQVVVADSDSREV